MVNQYRKELLDSRGLKPMKILVIPEGATNGDINCSQMVKNMIL